MTSRKNELEESVLGTIGSGNVFADLELPDAENRHLKAKLVLKIGEVIPVRHDVGAAAAGAAAGKVRPLVLLQAIEITETGSCA